MIALARIDLSQSHLNIRIIYNNWRWRWVERTLVLSNIVKKMRTNSPCSLGLFTVCAQG
jgi:hypothetical protein